MAKEIKVIKCPQCGSTAKTELKPDFYRCNNCHTEYFLDDDDVTINYNHNFNHNLNLPFNNDSSKKVIKVIALIIGVFIVLTILINVISAIFSPKSVATTSSTYSASPAAVEETGFSASRYSPDLFTQAGSNAAIAIVAEDRRYKAKSEAQKDGVYIAFYTPGKGLVAEHKVEGTHVSTSDIKFRTFSDGNLYVIANKSTLYVVDKSMLKLTDAGKKFFSAKEELQVGVATIEFVYEDNGDGLILLTNDGKKLYYYPLVQKLYNENKYYEARKGFSSLLPGAKEKVIHVFTRKSSDYPEDKLQLIKIRYKDNGAGPKDVVDNLSWGKDYGGSGIFTDRDPYKKVLFSDYTRQADRILGWKDLTPGRLYFEPVVMFDDGSSLLISFKPDANPNSGYKLQQLNSQTGAVEWTVDESKGSEIKRIIRYKNGFIWVTDDEELLQFDAKGKLTSTYKIE